MDIGAILSTQYAIVKNILECLPAFEILERAEHVCKLWKDVSRVVLRSRKHGECFYYEGGKFLPQKKILESIQQEFSEDFQHFLRRSIYSVPRICFILTTGDGGQFHYSDGKDIYPYDDYRHIYKTFPKCQSLCVSSFHGVVSPTHEIETLRYVRPSFTFLSFPSSPKFKIHAFDLTTNSSPDVVLKDLVPDIHEDEVIKGVIAFSSDGILYPTLARILANCAERSEGGKMAVAGGVISLTWQCSLEDERPELTMLKSNVTGLIFSGKGLSIKSVILSEDVNTPKAVERELSKLRPEEYPSNVESYAFMFACCGRGYGFYRKDTPVESSTFRRLFPHTHLVGCFCGGEIGLNSYPGCEPTRNIHEDNLFHAYTTVFMIISMDSC